MGRYTYFVDEQELKLRHAPIVEAVIDIDCDLPPTLDIVELEEDARNRFRDTYPKYAPIFLHEHKVEKKKDAPPEVSFRQEVQALQFLHDDEKQLVQLRKEGFSFNRLAPYSSLDDYLPEIARTWELFRELTKPVQVRAIRLRYINRLPLPTSGGQINLLDYLKIGPPIPHEGRLIFTGFLNQHSALERNTGNEVNVVLTPQTTDQSVYPIIFDITTTNAKTVEPDDWTSIVSRIQSLRNLKNWIFRDTLTEKCLKLFQ